MLASYDHESLEEYVSNVEIGITASVSQSVTSTAQDIINLPANATAGEGGLGYSAITAGSAGLRVVDSVTSTLDKPISGSISAGFSVSNSEYHQESTTANPSTVTAGRDIIAHADRDIVIEGGQLIADRNIDLDAGRDLLIRAAENSGSSSSSSNAFSAGVGLSASVNASGPSYGINANVNASGSESASQYFSHQNAVIVAGDTLSTTSGRDTTIAGGHLEADHVQMDVGRDLTVSSVQDSASSENSSWNAGVSVTVNPTGGGTSASISLGGGSGESQSNWVGEQTAIIGHESVDIYVEEHTHLEGAIIATDPGGDLVLDTGTLSYAEIHDSDEGRDWHAGVTGGWSTVGDIDAYEELYKQHIADNEPLPTQVPTTTTPSGNKTEAGYSSHDTEGVLRPTITEGQIIVRDDSDADLSGLNRDLDQAWEITKDENVNMDVYVSQSAIEEIISGFEGITDSAKAYLDLLGKVLSPPTQEEAEPDKTWPHRFISEEEVDAWLDNTMEGLEGYYTKKRDEDGKVTEIIISEETYLAVIEKAEKMTVQELKAFYDYYILADQNGKLDEYSAAEIELMVLIIATGVNKPRDPDYEGPSYGKMYMDFLLINNDPASSPTDKKVARQLLYDTFTYDNTFASEFINLQNTATQKRADSLADPDNIAILLQGTLALEAALAQNDPNSLRLLAAASQIYGRDLTAKEFLILSMGSVMLSQMTKDEDKTSIVPMADGISSNALFNWSDNSLSLKLEHFTAQPTKQDVVKELARLIDQELIHYYQKTGEFGDKIPFPPEYAGMSRDMYTYMGDSIFGDNHYRLQPVEIHSYGDSDFFMKSLRGHNYLDNFPTEKGLII